MLQLLQAATAISSPFAGGEAEEESVVGKRQGVAGHRPRPPHRRSRHRHRDDLAERGLGGRRDILARGCRRRRGGGRRQRGREDHLSAFVGFPCALRLSRNLISVLNGRKLYFERERYVEPKKTRRER